MTDASRGTGERPNGAMPEAKRILLEVVIVEDAPRPADHRIRMHVWNVVERELADNLVPHTYHRGQIIEAERIGRTHRGDEARDATAALDDLAQLRAERVDV